MGSLDSGGQGEALDQGSRSGTVQGDEAMVDGRGDGEKVSQGRRLMLGEDSPKGGGGRDGIEREPDGCWNF